MRLQAPRKMSALLKCLVLFCAVCSISGYTSVRDDVAWFKNGQRIKNRFVSGVVNGIIDVDCNDNVNGSDVEGECMSKTECTKAGGKIGSICSLLGVCCVMKKTCSETTSSKLSYFVPPAKFQEDCALTVNVYSKDVCQIRLDFERFDIAKPTSATKEASYQCHNDSFKVESAGKNLGFPHLCGRNKGQHIYVPISENQQKIVLHFKFKSRTSSNLNLPDWKIKIRQLECRRSGYDHLTAPTKLMTMYNQLKSKKKSGKSDWELIAPPNCLQYYPNKTGTFESFNFDDGKGFYIGHLDYAICFRKTPEVCGAKYTSEFFQMNYYKPETPEEREDKCHPRKLASPTVSQDYIRIPGGYNAQNIFRDYYCNQDFNAESNTVNAKSHEPLYVGVHTDGFRPNHDKEGDELNDVQEIGFRISYSLEDGSCDIPF